MGTACGGNGHGWFGAAPVGRLGFRRGLTGLTRNQLHTAFRTVTGAVADNLRVHGTTELSRARFGWCCLSFLWNVKIESRSSSGKTGEQQKADKVQMPGDDFHIAFS